MARTAVLTVDNVVSLETRQAARAMLTRYAKKIARMRENIFDEAVSMGELLADARTACKDAGVRWYDWLAKTGLGPDSAEKLMNLHKFISSKDADKIELAAKHVSLRAFLLLAAPSTPEETRTEILSRAEQGEEITSTEVRKGKQQAANKGEGSPLRQVQAKPSGEGAPALGQSPSPSTITSYPEDHTSSGQGAGEVEAAPPAQSKETASPVHPASNTVKSDFSSLLNQLSMKDVADCLGERRFVMLAELFGYIKEAATEMQSANTALKEDNDTLRAELTKAQRDSETLLDQLMQTERELAKAQQAEPVAPRFTAEALFALPDKEQDAFFSDVASDDRWRIGPRKDECGWKKVRWGTTLYAYLPTNTQHRNEFKRVIRMEQHDPASTKPAPPQPQPTTVDLPNPLRQEAKRPTNLFSEGFD